MGILERQFFQRSYFWRSDPLIRFNHSLTRIGMKIFTISAIIFSLLVGLSVISSADLEDNGDVLYATAETYEQDQDDMDLKFTNEDKNETIKSEAEAKLEYENEVKAKQAEALRVRKINGRKQEGINAVKRTIHAASSDNCDWKTQPLAFIKGEVCGSHYKVLGIDRKSKLTDKSKIKKKYRQLSLHLHPDKNPSNDAEDAFNVLQGAYNCILDDECKENYDQILTVAEEEIASKRQKLKKIIIGKSVVALYQAHHYLSLSASRIYQTGMNFWDMMGDWQVTIFDESYPLGRPLALIALLWKGQFLLKLHALSYAIMRINYEISKSRGWS